MSYPRSLSVALVCLIPVLLTLTANAADIRVPADQPTIQSAISMATNGDEIRVAPGTYIENLNFLGKAIRVTSEQGPQVTTIDGNQSGSVVVFTSGEGPLAVLSGFTVRNGKAAGPSR